MVYGWAGTILRIDLTTGKVAKTPSAEYTRAFLGGRGVNAKLLYEEAKPNQSPYDPEAPLIFGVGALAGTGLIGTSRMEVTGISPAKTETHSYGNVGMGGHWAPELKFAGYDNIVISGRAEKPVYIFIDNDAVEIRNASGVWGKGVFETQTLIREELGDEDVQVASIGQAGENLAVMATIEQGYRSGTALGASMGAKRLKSVAVRGTKPVKIYDPEKILEYNETLFDLWKPYAEATGPHFGKEGKDAYQAGFVVTDSGVVGDYESHEWRDRPDIKKAYEEGYIGEHFSRLWGCFGCPFPCMSLYNVPEVGACVFRCYPTYWPWRVWITDMKTSFEATRLMADYGLEMREIATDVSWLMCLYHDGVITAEDTDDVAFERGSREALLETIRKVAFREGFGDTLADGAVALAKKLGPEAEKYLIQSKGVTMRTFEYRLEPGTALGEAIAARGNSMRATTYHLVLWEKPPGPGFPGTPPDALAASKAWAKKMFGTEEAVNPIAYEGKPTALIYEMHGQALADALGFCGTMTRPKITGPTGARIGDPSYQFAAERFTAATGVPMDEKGLFMVAERIVNLERALVVRDGQTRETDTLPDFYFEVGIADGPWKGRKLDRAKFEEMKDEYYALRGWDVETGLPTRERLTELGLADVADDLEKLEKLSRVKREV